MAVEAQNYLIWPLLFILLERFVRKRGRIFSLVLIGALISVTLMAVLYVPGADPTRVYYGTDTRVFSILLGSALAYVWPSTRLKEEIPEASKNLKWRWFKCLNSFSVSLFNIIRSYKFCLLRRHVFN